MSERSFQLRRQGDQWLATLSGFTKIIEVKCGDGSREAAEEIARATLHRRCQQAEAAKQRWRVSKVRQLSPAAGSTPIDSEDETPVELPPATPPPPVPEADPPPSPSPERAEQIRAKLLALGDGRPIEPDEVHAPGEGPRAETSDDPPMDEEAGELLADIIAGAVTMGHVKFIAGRLKRRNPPKRPGEPNERMMQWEREGIAFNCKKLLGKATAMGPTAKMFVGAGLMTIGMFIDAEPIEGATSSSSAPAEPAPAAPDPDPPPQRKTNVSELFPLGRFK